MSVSPPRPKTRAPGTGQSAVSLLDESVHRLRLAPPGTLTIYYVGTLPFILALLYFWADQGHSPDADTHGTTTALGVALLFVLMKICQGVFAARLGASIRQRHGAPWSWGRLGRLALMQTALQPSGLFALAVASVLTIPLGWVYAFYQNITVLGDGDLPSIRAVFVRAARHALHQPKQNHAGLALLSILALFVWANLILAAYGLPQLAHMITGEENLFTRSGTHLFNTTFFAVTGALVYLALDPLAKTFYVLRCFYADSRRTGEDLRGELAALPAPAAGTTAVLALLAAMCVVLGPGRTAHAAVVAASPAPVPVAVSPPAPASVSPPELGRSIDEVLRRREFAWRTPRTVVATQQTGALDSFFDRLGQRWKVIQGAMQRWFDNVSKHLRDLAQSRDQSKRPETDFAAPNTEVLRGLVIGLIVVLAAAFGLLTWRHLRGTRSGVAEGRSAPGPAAPTPDLTADTVLATLLPEDEWLALARRLVASGDRRLALRAFYLSILAALGERGLLIIARHKSNRDYVLELRRRARDRSDEVQCAFARNVHRFERVWYGEHDADDLLLADFQTDRERVLG